MNSINLNYSSSSDALFVRLFTLPKVGEILTTFFFKKVINFYTKMLFEYSGFELYIDDLGEKDATKFLKMFNYLHYFLGILISNQTFLNKNEKTRELGIVINKLEQKVGDIIEKLEDISFSNFAYQASTSYKNNDWNSPENDHWDNY